MVLLIEDLLTIQNLIEKNTYVLIDFTASWCGPCKKSTPIFNEYFNQMPSKFICVIADIDVVSKKFFNCSSVVLIQEVK